MKKKYNIYVESKYELDMVSIIKEFGLPGLMWPNKDTPQFDLELTEEELLILRLKLPLTYFIS